MQESMALITVLRARGITAAEVSAAAAAWYEKASDHCPRRFAGARPPQHRAPLCLSSFGPGNPSSGDPASSSVSLLEHGAAHVRLLMPII